jgi:hypothetical protein
MPCSITFAQLEFAFLADFSRAIRKTLAVAMSLPISKSEYQNGNGKKIEPDKTHYHLCGTIWILQSLLRRSL